MFKEEQTSSKEKKNIEDHYSETMYGSGRLNYKWLAMGKVQG